MANLLLEIEEQIAAAKSETRGKKMSVSFARSAMASRELRA